MSKITRLIAITAGILIIGGGYLGVRQYQNSQTEKTSCANLPEEVKSVIDRTLECHHWGGESGYSKERIDEINAGYEEAGCSTIAEDQAGLLNKYAGNEKVINAIKAASDWDKGYCE